MQWKDTGAGDAHDTATSTGDDILTRYACAAVCMYVHCVCTVCTMVLILQLSMQVLGLCY